MSAGKKQNQKTSKTTPKINFFANVQTGSAGASKSEILQVIRKECASTGEAIGVKEIAVILGCDDSKVRKSLQKIRKTAYNGYEEKLKEQTLTSVDGKEKLKFVANHDLMKEKGVLYAIWDAK